MQPQTPLCVRHVAAQLAGESGFGTLSHGLAPIPAFPRKRGKEKCALCLALGLALCLALCLLASALPSACSCSTKLRATSTAP
jgi:hypothetical protein